MTCMYGRRSHTGVCLRPALFTFHFDIASESGVVVAVISHFYAFSRLPHVLKCNVGADSVVSFLFPICFGGFSDIVRKKTIKKLAKLLAGVTNERINGGHAQREREASHALHSMREQGVSTNMAALWYKRRHRHVDNHAESQTENSFAHYSYGVNIHS